MTSNSYPDFYKKHPATCSRDDFWGQVKRTVNGKPVPQEQIDMIIESTVSALDLGPHDKLLDLCCGNGALSTDLFKRCSGGVGVDYSEYLIDVAHEFFERPLRESYILADVAEYVTTISETKLFTKALCYGSFQYLTLAQARILLTSLRKRFKGIARFFIGNLPDKGLLKEFYREREYAPGVENDHTSAIGIWRSRQEFCELAEECGWRVSFSKMPEDFYAAHYRYDTLLTPFPEDDNA